MSVPQEKITYSSPDHDNLCFRHAVFVAMAGLHIEATIADRPVYCVLCEEYATITNLRKNRWRSSKLKRKVL